MIGEACWSRLLGAGCSQAQIRGRGRRATLRKPCLPQIVIGLDYFAQLVLRGAVTLVVVGMEPLYQLLEAGLDVGLGRAVLEIKLAQALPLGALEGPLRRPALGLGGALGEQSERVVGGKAVRKAAGPLALAGLSIARPGIDPERPGRAVADDIFLLVLGDRFVGEPGEVIVGLVVFAHMIEAEAVILPLEPSSLGRRIEAGLLAAGPVARRIGVAQEPVLVGLDPQAVEEF